MRSSVSMKVRISLLVEPMIAAGQNIDAGGEKIVGDIARDAEAAGGVLAIGDDEIDGEPLAQAGQLGREHVAPGPADHIADEKNPHALIFQTYARRSSVTIQSSASSLS